MRGDAANPQVRGTVGTKWEHARQPATRPRQRQRVAAGWRHRLHAPADVTACGLVTPAAGSDGYLLHLVDDDGHAMCDDDGRDELTVEPMNAWRDRDRPRCPACEQLAVALGIN